MLHLKNEHYGPEHSREVVYKARDLASDMSASIRVARIARKFVELDVSVEKEELDELLKKLEPIGSVVDIRHVFEEEIEKEIVHFKQAQKHIPKNRCPVSDKRFGIH